MLYNAVTLTGGKFLKPIFIHHFRTLK